MNEALALIAEWIRTGHDSEAVADRLDDIAGTLALDERTRELNDVHADELADGS